MMKVLLLVIGLAVAVGASAGYAAITRNEVNDETYRLSPTDSAKELTSALYKYQLAAWQATYKRRYKGASVREAWSAAKLNPQAWQSRLRLTIVRKGQVVRKMPIAKWRIDLPLVGTPSPEQIAGDLEDDISPQNSVARKYERFSKAPTNSRKPKYRMRLTALDVDRKRSLVLVGISGATDQEPYLTWKRGFDWGLLRTINLMENIKIPNKAELRVGSKTKFRRAFYRKNGEPPRKYERSSFLRFARYVSKNSWVDLELTWRASRKTTLRGLLRTRPRYITTQESER